MERQGRIEHQPGAGLATSPEGSLACISSQQETGEQIRLAAADADLKRQHQEWQPFLAGWRWRLYAGLSLGMPGVLLLCPGWWPWWVPLMVGVHAVAAVATCLPNAKLFGDVVTDFPTTRREVWLTIDDGPHPEDTPAVLALLREHNAKATFCVIGRQVEAHPGLARQIVREGHELANHTHTHPIYWFWLCLPWAIRRQLRLGNKAIREATGANARWFRSPLGMSNCFVHRLLPQEGMRMLGWSARGFDGIRQDIDIILPGLLAGIRPGAIILLHEGRRDAAGRAVNVQVLERLLQALKERGYRCVVPPGNVASG